MDYFDRWQRTRIVRKNSLPGKSDLPGAHAKAADELPQDTGHQSSGRYLLKSREPENRPRYPGLVHDLPRHTVTPKARQQLDAQRREGSYQDKTNLPEKKPPIETHDGKYRFPVVYNSESGARDKTIEITDTGLLELISDFESRGFEIDERRCLVAHRDVLHSSGMPSQYKDAEYAVGISMVRKKKGFYDKLNQKRFYDKIKEKLGLKKKSMMGHYYTKSVPDDNGNRPLELEECVILQAGLKDNGGSITNTIKCMAAPRVKIARGYTFRGESGPRVDFFILKKYIKEEFLSESSTKCMRSWLYREELVDKLDTFLDRVSRSDESNIFKEPDFEYIIDNATSGFYKDMGILNRVVLVSR